MGKLFVVPHRSPANHRGLHLFDYPVRDEQQRTTLGSQKILVRIGGKAVDMVSLHIELQASKTLNRIDHEKNSAVSAELTNTAKIGTEAASKLNPAQCEHARSVVYQRQKFLRIYAPGFFTSNSQLNFALVANSHPRIDI